MSKVKKQSFLYGATILGLAMIFVKIIGALFKIPLGNILGNTGMGYFSTAYNLFVPIYTLAIAGFPAAISRMVSEYSIKKRYKDVKKILRISTFFFFLTGTLGFIAIFLLAKPFVNTFADYNAFLSVIFISPAIFFGCIMASFRGYYEGLQNMVPTAFSQIVEGVVKLVFGLLLSSVIMNIGFFQYESNGIVFGVVAKSIEEANLVILPYAAAGAILGATLSTVLSMLYLIIRHRCKGDGITRVQLIASPKSNSSKKIFMKLLKVAIPISIGALVINLTSFIDLVTIMMRLEAVVNNNVDKLIAMFNGMIPQEVIESNKIPNYLWGAYGGIAVSVFNLVPSFTGIFAKSALPNITAIWVLKDKDLLKKNIESVIRITSLVAIPAGMGISVMASPILSLLYSAQSNDALVASSSLSVMGIGVIFLSLLVPIFSIFQAIGRQFLPVIFMIFGAIIKFVTNYIFVGIPSFNIIGAAIGTIFCYGTILILSIFSLISVSKVRLDFISVFVKPAIASTFCAAAAWSSYGLMGLLIGSNIRVVLSVFIGGFVYILSLFLVKGISKDDVIMLPKGEKLSEFLERKKLI